MAKEFQRHKGHISIEINCKVLLHPRYLVNMAIEKVLCCMHTLFSIVSTEDWESVHPPAHTPGLCLSEAGRKTLFNLLTVIAAAEELLLIQNEDKKTGLVLRSDIFQLPRHGLNSKSHDK